MPWAKFAELIYPNILGHIAIHNVTWYWGGGLYPGMGSAFLFNAYCGILVISLAHAVNPWLYKLPYDPIKAFAPIGVMGSGPNVVAVKQSTPDTGQAQR